MALKLSQRLQTRVTEKPTLAYGVCHSVDLSSIYIIQELSYL